MKSSPKHSSRSFHGFYDRRPSRKKPNEQRKIVCQGKVSFIRNPTARVVAAMTVAAMDSPNKIVIQATFPILSKPATPPPTSRRLTL
jgi:hypothetical protein